MNETEKQEGKRRMGMKQRNGNEPGMGMKQDGRVTGTGTKKEWE